MSGIVILGAQWGDEGKGKIVDVLTEKAHGIIRFQGGNNAGHTLIVKGEKTVLHLLPSGILHKGKFCVIGNGVVLDPEILLQEIEQIKKRGYLKKKGQLLISERAHLILPYHRLIDQLRESSKGNAKIGTTGRGIGPAYEDKVARRGIRMGDFINPKIFKEKFKQNLAEHNRYIVNVLGGKALDYESLLSSLLKLSQKLKAYVCDTSSFLQEQQRKKKKLLFEGAQGTLLDVDHGTYPYVTSSNTVSANAAIGSGVGPKTLSKIIGVTKAYCTRVGSGPFPTELNDSTGSYLQEKGGEVGATTGRRRRCGWLDLVALKHAIDVNGIDELVLTKLDVLSGLDKIGLCVGYKLGNKVFKQFPNDASVLEKCRPVYKYYKGWQQDISGLRSFNQLPQAAQAYVKSLEKILKIPFAILSVGPSRDQNIWLKTDF